MDENTVKVQVCDYEDLIVAAHEVQILRRMLQKKLDAFDGFTHDEVENICLMLGMSRREEYR